MFLCLTIRPNSSNCNPAVIAPCSTVGRVHELCKCHIECGEESSPAWVDQGYCSQWSAGYGQVDHGCFSRTVTVCSVHGPDQNGRTNNLLFVEYWVLSLAVTRRWMRPKLKTRLTARYVRGHVQWETSRIYNGAEKEAKHIVVSATPPPTVSPSRTQIASQSQQISVASCTWLFCYDMPTLDEDSTFFETSHSLNPATRRHISEASNLKLNAMGSSSLRILPISGPHSEGQNKALYFHTRNLFQCLAVKCPLVGQQTEQHQWNYWLCWWNFAWSGSVGPNKVN